ncbi:SDR family NAD(P)-dependent oxidoreductase [Nocardia abscessus]|uniref:SDR family NAD(P)-dependent oxidoreductase n=1 Tax=Nocardia abscessus TaxID=120957 RepID=UPI0002F43A0F|nr:SDR family NAD(P)-dependent oxidoreductase [Nocardia abscessus]MCC3332150.1 SDR family NAD(P)-dependent oxidoreductase [Nocardia abscessus]
MNPTISPRSALVTGGSSGVGFALAQQLAAAGYHVLICGRDPDRLANAAARIPRLRTVRANLADPADVDRVASIAAGMPGLDLVINNAAVQFDRQWMATNTDELVGDLIEELGANLAAPLRLTARLLPILADAPRATVVNITSALGVVPKRSAPVYCAAKAGLIAATASLQRQLARDAPTVRVVEAMLPLVDTAMTAGRGRGKISPAAAAAAVLAGLQKRRIRRIRVGLVYVLLGVHRLSPALAGRLVSD